jgi:thiamine-phosphate diphosphorylase
VTTPADAAPALPALLVLTDRRAAAARGRSLGETVAAAVAGGARAVVLREKDLARATRARLAQRLGELLAPVGGVLVVASDPSLGGDGVHLGVSDAPVRGRLVGRSCHDAAGLGQAAREGCAYATVSPVFPTPSKPGYGPPLGPEGLRALVESASLPVYALGGIDAATTPACRQAGAAGVAVMGAVMGAADPAVVVATLLTAWHGEQAVARGRPSS